MLTLEGDTLGSPSELKGTSRWASVATLVGVGSLLYLAVTYGVAIAGGGLTDFDYAGYGLTVARFAGAIYILLRVRR